MDLNVKPVSQVDYDKYKDHPRFMEVANRFNELEGRAPQTTIDVQQPDDRNLALRAVRVLRTADTKDLSCLLMYTNGVNDVALKVFCWFTGSRPEKRNAESRRAWVCQIVGETVWAEYEAQLRADQEEYRKQAAQDAEKAKLARFDEIDRTRRYNVLTQMPTHTEGAKYQLMTFREMAMYYINKGYTVLRPYKRGAVTRTEVHSPALNGTVELRNKNEAEYYQHVLDEHNAKAKD